ncbi:Argonaute-like protein [Mycena kentingensis (nom. inval.)]|nr:Argonaute-like protein [Mycena kentingensis (nom. inval.)]
MPPRATPQGPGGRGGRGGGGGGGGRGNAPGGGRGASLAGGGGGGGRGGPRGAAPRGGHTARGGALAPLRTFLPFSAPYALIILVAGHITTVGVRRPAFGSAGRSIQVIVNALSTTIPEGSIFHYDGELGAFHPYMWLTRMPDKQPERVNRGLIAELQDRVAPAIFAEARVVYDGKKSLYSHIRLGLPGPKGDEGSAMGRPAPGTDAAPRQTAKAPDGQDQARKQGRDRALNVAIKMGPAQRFPTKGRSFFVPEGNRQIGAGLELWRGYFQSLRPTLSGLVINVDISTGVMYRQGPLTELCQQFLGLGQNDTGRLTAQMPDRRRLQLQRFLVGVRVKVKPAAARSRELTMRSGETMTVANYFKRESNASLRFPDVLCIEVGSGALIPLERCTVLPGQLFKKDFPDEKRTEMVEFSTQKPPERLASIRASIQRLAYGQSEYVRKFGLNVANDVITAEARIIDPPKLKYGGTGAGANIIPRFGAWNMADRKLYRPAAVGYWVLVVLDQGFRDNLIGTVAHDFVAGCKAVGTRSSSLNPSSSVNCPLGMQFRDDNPLVRRINPQNLVTQLTQAGQACMAEKKGPPALFVVILPNLGNSDLYNDVKYWGDVERGVPTQCLKSQKCSRANAQFWANVALKVNVKMGGINVITDPTTLMDPNIPTIVMGADVMHPAPGAKDRPSFPALVASVDANCAKYVAKLGIQRGKLELIPGLGEMAEELLKMHMDYRRAMDKVANAAPTRLIFYRDGVSEGQFPQVLEQELPLIKGTQACKNLKIKPKITFIVVGKRHHFRFFPTTAGDTERSGNLPAGTVVERDIGHPLELDYYLLSHSGILGTSRPSHYSVLYDENNFTPDALQAWSFALCHVYARATRSVSIPAPVYYADIVCSRAKHHFNPNVNPTETGTTATDDTDAIFAQQESDFKKVHSAQSKLMYFS